MVEETVTKLIPLMDIIPPLLPADNTHPSTHTPSSTRTLRPRPARQAIPQRVPVSRKRVHTQRADMVQEQLLPRKRGKMSGVARRSGSAGADDDVDGIDGAASTRVGIVRRNAMRTGDVVVKEEATSASVLFPTVEGGVSGGSGGIGLSPTRDVEAKVGVQGDDGVKMEVKREVKKEVKEESNDDEDDEDDEYYYDDDEDGCGSGDTGDDSDGDAARVRTEIKREVKSEVKGEVRRDMGEKVEEDVSRGAVQLTATQSDTGVRPWRNPWVCATNPHGFMPATLARLQELSPEAREREMEKLLKKKERDAKRRSDPAVRQMINERMKERYEKNREKFKQRLKVWRENHRECVLQQKKRYREKNIEKEKQRYKEYYEKNIECVKQRNKDRYEKNKEKEKQQQKVWREKNKEKVKQYSKEYREKNKDLVTARRREWRARKKAEREAL